jgi:archaemetzincin
MMLLVPIGFSTENQLMRLRILLEARFHVKVDISQNELDPLPFFDSNRNQYNSSEIVRQLEKDFPEEASKVLGITGLDLFIPILTFVFGEARLHGRCAVVSSFRLDNRFYGLPGNPKLLQERLFKEAIHELGHTYGLIHCHSPECIMKSSTYVEEIDFKSDRFCDKCLDKLQM